MKKQLRALALAWVISPRKVGTEPLYRKKQDSPVKHSWKVSLRWYSPVVWVFFLLTLIRGIIKGALLGMVGVVKTTFYPRPATHSVVLDKGEKMKWYMYY